MNIIHEENFILSTAEPRIIATLIQAKVIWKSTKMRVGMVPDIE